MVFNKIDLYNKLTYDELLDDEGRREIEEQLHKNIRNQFGTDSVFISARTKENLDELRQKLTRMIKTQYNLRYPHQARMWS